MTNKQNVIFKASSDTRHFVQTQSMSNEDFETWFLDKHGLKAAKPTAFNATQSNWLRASVATYSVHLRLATALNLPLVQWLWLVNGALLGLAVVLVLLLAYLLQMMISLQKAQVHLLRKLEEIYGGDGKEDEKGEKDRGLRKGSKSKISGGGRSAKKKEKKKSKQSKSSASPKRQTLPGKGTSITTTKKSRSKSPSPKTTNKTTTSPTTSISVKKKTN